MRVVASDAVRSHIAANGGVLYVRSRVQRCCSGPLTFLDASTERPADLTAYQESPADGFTMMLALGAERPAELAVEMRGLWRKHPVASWDGCVFRLDL